MSATGRVVIVGAGVVGASVAWHLLRRGVRDVIIVDRAPRPGLGSTGAATGGFRAQFASPTNVRLSLLAREKLRRFRDEVGADAGYVAVGYLWLASSPADLDALSAARRVQHAEGLTEAVEVSPDEISRLNPAIAPEGIVGGAFCPTDGYLKPLAILEGYLAAAAHGGARILWDHDVRGLDRDGSGRVHAVRTTRATIGCDAVVNAGGAWARTIARFAGVDLPVEPLRRQVAMTAPTRAISDEAPMTIWSEDGFHLRPREGRVLLAFPTPGDRTDPWSLAIEPAWLSRVAALKDARVPPLRGVALDPSAGWAGLYEMSPDRHAILGFDPACPNLVLANGSSGHGVMHAPAIGQLVAELLVDGRAVGLDVTSLRPTRFAENAPNPPELL